MRRLIPLLLLTGCTSIQPFTWLDGGPAWLIRCDTPFSDNSDCYALAAAQCAQGWTALDQGECNTAISCPYGSLPIQRRYLIARCEP